MLRLFAFLSVLLASKLAFAQQLQLQLENDEAYANLPFVLQVVARGFEESPQPTLSKLQIPGCRITPLGVAPQVSSMIEIVNGQRHEQRNVTFAFRFRIEAEKAGQYTVPALTADQNGKKAQSPPARFSVRAIEDSSDMQLRVVLPDRPLWVGETVDGAIEWYLRRDVGNRSFSIPLFDQEEWLEISAPPGEPKLGGFHTGSKQLELPIEQSKATLDGQPYTRVRLPFRLTPNKPGILMPPAARVAAELQVGNARDFMGFLVPQSKLFQAVAKPMRIEIKSPPLANRPPSFKNAVGQAFQIEVQASQTVVRVGDPIELRILLRGKGRLAGLILPDPAAMGLPASFATPEEPPSGELLDDGKGKLFRVSVRLRSTDAHEIPALAFSYFDPESGKYETVRSQPLALAVKGSAVVAAGDVVAMPKPEATGAQTPAKADGKSAPQVSLVGADLALGDEKLAWRRAPSLQRVVPILIGLYAAAIGLLILHAVRVRKRVAWQHDAAVAKSLQLLRGELRDAEKSAARDSAPRICAALRALRKQLALPADAGKSLLDRLETESYSPSAARDPLPAALRGEVEALAQSWNQTSARSAGAGATAALFALIGAGSLVGALAHAQDSAAEAKLKRARTAYQAALAESDRDRRRGGFAEAEGSLRELSAAYPDRPQLIADWGNAALLAQEPGRAVLAYRRALALDPSLQRARTNLSFLRDRLPDWLPRPHRSGALESILFVNQSLPAPHRQIGLALFVLLTVVLIIPWSARRRRILRTLAIVPLAGAALFALSIFAEHDATHDAVVVVAGGTLRAADSLGAPAALAQPLPAGSEVAIDEARGDFTRVTLADGRTGWLPSGTLEAVYLNGPNSH